MLATAMEVAEFWAKVPRATSAAGSGTPRRCSQEKIRSLPAGWREQEDDATSRLPTAPIPIPLQSTVVTASAHPDGMVVVKMEDRQAKNMFSDALHGRAHGSLRP